VSVVTGAEVTRGCNVPDFVIMVGVGVAYGDISSALSSFAASEQQQQQLNDTSRSVALSMSMSASLSLSVCLSVCELHSVK